MDGFALLSEVVELFGGHFKKCGNFVDKGARAARAASVHAHIGNRKAVCLFVVFEEDHFRILSAKLDGGACGGVMCAHCKRIGYNLLHIGQVQGFCQSCASRTAQGGAHGNAPKLLVQFGKQALQAVCLLGMMAHIAAHKHFMRRCVHNGDFRCCGSNVYTYKELRRLFVLHR